MFDVSYKAAPKYLKDMFTQCSNKRLRSSASNEQKVNSVNRLSQLQELEDGIRYLLTLKTGPALAFWRPYANKNLAAPDHHKSQSVTIES